MNVGVFLGGMVATFFCIFVIYVGALSDRGYRSLENWYVATMVSILILAFGFIFTAGASGAWKKEPEGTPTPIYIIVTATPEADKR